MTGPERRLDARSGLAIAISMILILSGFLWITFDHANAANRKQNREALELVYKTQLASCRRGLAVRNAVRANGQYARSLAIKINGIANLGLARAKVTAADPNSSAAQRKGALDAIQFDTSLITPKDKLPIVPPKPPKCSDVVSDPTQLARQVQTDPGT